MEPSVALRRAAVLVAVEGVALALLGLVDAVASAVGQPANRVLSFTAAGFALGTGLLLLLLARALHRARGWSRSPTVVVQLLAFPVGTGLAQGRVWIAAAAVLFLAGATTFHLVKAGPAFPGE